MKRGFPVGRERLWLYLSYHVVVCIVFITKYGVRYGFDPVLSSLAYCLLVAGGVWACVRSPRLRRHIVRPKQAILFVVFASIALAVLMSQFDISLIRNARHASLDLSVSRLWGGEFPYQGPEYNSHSAFPVWFLIAAPFYAMGDSSLLILLGLPLLSWALWSIDRRYVVCGCLLAIASPQFLYEIVTRSEIVLNMSLILAGVLMAEKLRRESGQTLTSLGGALLGAILSSRAITWMVFGAYIGYVSASSWRQSLAIAVSVIPFAVWDWGKFVAFGPIAHQARLSGLSPVVLAAAILIPVALGRLSRSVEDVLELCAVLLMGVVSFAFLQSVWTQGLHAAIMESRFDITYLIIPMPFIIASIVRLMPACPVEPCQIAH